MTTSREVVSWGDVAAAASSMFRVWAFGGEQDWVEECWGHFKKDGLTSADDMLEETKTRLRLLALAKIYEEFSGLMWDENPDTPINFLTDHLELDGTALGILAALDSEFDGSGIKDANGLREYALTTVSHSLRPEIFGCLADAYGGDNALFLRMAQTIKDPKDDDEDDDGDLLPHFSSAVRPSAAWSFVSNCFQTG